MEIFIIFQILFDAVLLFSVLFLFHYSTNLISKKKEDSDLINDIQLQEIKGNLQELLLTLQQVGKRVSDDIQVQVRIAENKTAKIKKFLSKFKSDITKTPRFSNWVVNENDKKGRLFGKINKPIVKIQQGTIPNKISKGVPGKNMSKSPLCEAEEMISFSSEIVREIYRLADEDYELNEIVRLTKLSLAEIQLILNLRGKNFTTHN